MLNRECLDGIAVFTDVMHCGDVLVIENPVGRTPIRSFGGMKFQIFVNASVQVMLFRDRLEIWSPGGLPKGMTIAKLGKLHHSVPVNPLLAQAMYLRGYIEKVGSGTRDMVTKSRAWGNEAPVWEIEDGDDFRVVLKRPDIGGVRAASATTRKTTSNTTSKTSRYTSSKTSRCTARIAPLRSDLEAACEGLTGNARKIMQVISEDPGVTIESLATLVKLTPDGVRYHLKALAKSVGLHHSSDRKGGEWEVAGPKKLAQETTREMSPQAAQETTQETTQETAQEGLSVEDEKILACIRIDAAITRKLLAEKLGISSDRVKRRLDVLKAKLGLRHEGPTKKGRWVFGPKPKGNRGVK